MLHTIAYKVINKHDFAAQVEEYRSVIKGKGRTIAKLAKVDYGVYRNAMSGRIANPVILTSILRAVKIEAYKVEKQYAA